MRNAGLDIEDLRTFVVVADAGGVSAAARRLSIAKSIVSRRLFKEKVTSGAVRMLIQLMAVRVKEENNRLIVWSP
ncbi:LysR family transcriptional regulator [Serratia nevei]|uniref:LysR family transcriptional regulator n=1 Tax=Serratia nevei TaxID=2703794 RepID=UPI003FA728C4